MFVWESKLHSQVAWIQRPWNWTRQVWSWFGYIIESIFFNGNTWTDLYNLNNCYSLLFVSNNRSFSTFTFPIKNQEDRSAGQVKWVQPHLRNCIQQIFSPRIWPTWPHKGENWELRHSEKNIAKYYCQLNIDFFTAEELGLRWFCWQQWRTLSEGHERAHWSKSLCKSIVIVNRFNKHNKNQISIANG